MRMLIFILRITTNVMETLPTLQQELKDKETAYWDAHDAFIIARDALAAVRNEIKERLYERSTTNQ